MKSSAYDRKPRTELVFELLIFALVAFLIVVFWENNTSLAILLLVLYLVLNRLCPKEHDRVYFITGVVFGSVVEIIAIHAGGWSYSNPSFLGIPLWLPIAWGLAASMITRIAETFVKLGSEKK